MPANVKQRMERVSNLINLKIQAFLDTCETEVEQMFILNYFEMVFDKITGDWFSHSFDDSEKPHFQYPDNPEYGNYFPSSLSWYETEKLELRQSLKHHLIELVPQYILTDKQGSFKYKISFALFYPRSDGHPERIKVAIDCDGHKLLKKDIEKTLEKDKYLRSEGWLIARFTGAKIYQKDIYDLIFEVDKLTVDKDYELWHQTDRQKDNWKYN